MDSKLDPTDHELLLELQKGIPLVRCPFNEIGERLGMTGFQTVEKIKSFFCGGQARRLGGIFDARRLGYKSALCAVSLPDEQKDAVAGMLVRHPGITHCYARSWPKELPEDAPGGPAGHGPLPNLWFTLTVYRKEFDRELVRLQAAIGAHRILILPALHRFKIDVIFDPRTRERSGTLPGIVRTPQESGQEDFPEFTAAEKCVIRMLDGNLPLIENPFDQIARDAGYDPDGLLELLNRWEAGGILRRIALIVYHQKIGFNANGMCVWPVEQNRITEAGRRLARFPEVTHCYQRPKSAAFPYDIYAMIHRESWPELHQLFMNLSAEAGLVNGRLLCSAHEYKKCSMNYFRT
jgi:DNA-binding Lrp family transcriptional regulator